MARVAIAGGSSSTLGVSIISALEATGGRYLPVILSREPKANHASILGTRDLEVRQVDYHSHSSLVAALCDVEVVISVLLIPGPDWVTAQINLLHAAEEANCRRFAPSEFALSGWAQARVDILESKNVVWRAVQSSVDLGRIDAARFPCGMFMNYLGIGCPGNETRTEALAGFQEGPYLFHLDNHDSPWVDVPVRRDGTFPSLTMTDIRDVGRFVVAALDLPEPWAGRELGMAGDTLSFDELLALCRQHTGMAIEARAVTVEQLRTQLNSVPSNQLLARMELQLSIVCTCDGSIVKPVLNKLCSIQPTRVDEYLQRYWGPFAKDLPNNTKADSPVRCDI